MCNRIREIMDERRLRVSSFARDIGIPQSTMATIYHGKTAFDKIRIDTFIRIAHGLGMTADQLWDEVRAADADDVRLVRLTSDERYVVESYRATDDRGRQVIMAAAQSQRGMAGEVQASMTSA